MGLLFGRFFGVWRVDFWMVAVGMGLFVGREEEGGGEWVVVGEGCFECAGVEDEELVGGEDVVDWEEEFVFVVGVVVAPAAGEGVGVAEVFGGVGGMGVLDGAVGVGVGDVVEVAEDDDWCGGLGDGLGYGFCLGGAGDGGAADLAEDVDGGEDDLVVDGVGELEGDVAFVGVEVGAFEVVVDDSDGVGADEDVGVDAYVV